MVASIGTSGTTDLLGVRLELFETLNNLVKL